MQRMSSVPQKYSVISIKILIQTLHRYLCLYREFLPFYRKTRLIGEMLEFDAVICNQVTNYDAHKHLLMKHKATEAKVS